MILQFQYCNSMLVSSKFHTLSEFTKFGFVIWKQKQEQNLKVTNLSSLLLIHQLFKMVTAEISSSSIIKVEISTSILMSLNFDKQKCQNYYIDFECFLLCHVKLKREQIKYLQKQPFASHEAFEAVLATQQSLVWMDLVENKSAYCARSQV